MAGGHRSSRKVSSAGPISGHGSSIRALLKTELQVTTFSFIAKSLAHGMVLRSHRAAIFIKRSDCRDSSPPLMLWSRRFSTSAPVSARGIDGLAILRLHFTMQAADVPLSQLGRNQGSQVGHRQAPGAGFSIDAWTGARASYQVSTSPSRVFCPVCGTMVAATPAESTRGGCSPWLPVC